MLSFMDFLKLSSFNCHELILINTEVNSFKQLFNTNEKISLISYCPKDVRSILSQNKSRQSMRISQSKRLRNTESLHFWFKQQRLEILRYFKRYWTRSMKVGCLKRLDSLDSIRRSAKSIQMHSDVQSFIKNLKLQNLFLTTWL